MTKRERLILGHLLDGLRKCSEFGNEIADVWGELYAENPLGSAIKKQATYLADIADMLAYVATGRAAR